MKDSKLKRANVYTNQNQSKTIIMKKLFTLGAVFALTMTANADNRKWDFTNWSSETVANLAADYNANGGSNWTSVEKRERRRPDQRQLLLVRAGRGDRAVHPRRRRGDPHQGDPGPRVQLLGPLAGPGRQLPDGVGRHGPFCRPAVPLDGRQEQQVHHQGREARRNHHHGG